MKKYYDIAWVEMVFVQNADSWRELPKNSICICAKCHGIFP